MERIKYKAEREGKEVTVDIGILSVDGIPTYSLNEGFFNVSTDG
jgi:hypothetical protein